MPDQANRLPIKFSQIHIELPEQSDGFSRSSGDASNAAVEPDLHQDTQTWN